MDAQREEFLDTAAAGEEDERAPELPEFLYGVVVRQIIGDDPPEVWQTACRLVAAGLEPIEAMVNLVALATWALREQEDGPPAFDDDHLAAYLDALPALPLPAAGVVADLLVEAAADGRATVVDDLTTRVVARLGEADPSGRLAWWVEQVLDELLVADGPLLMIYPGRVVHLGVLAASSVFTHRLSAAEREAGWLETEVDLAVPSRLEAPLRLAAGGVVELTGLEDGTPVLCGPPGWLDRFAPGTVLEVAARDGLIALAESGAAPAPDAGTVAAVRAAYDREVAESGLPVVAEEIVAGVLDAAPETFAVPRAPVSELCAAAGLERRGAAYGHDASVWRSARMLAHLDGLRKLADSPDELSAGVEALEAFETDERDPGQLVRSLAALRHPTVLSVVADELFDEVSEPEQLDRVDSFAVELAGAARRPAQAAPAHWLRALVAERRLDPFAGQAHLEIAVDADPTWPPALDRLAWYRSDRGDAAGAVRLWRSADLGVADEPEFVQTLAFAEPSTVKIPRNQPCWCGSGRKFKHCHLGRPATPSLPDRVGWIYCKAAAYLRRRGLGPGADLAWLAMTRAGGDISDEALERALADPLVLDVALHEGGWLEQFLAERGALLPADEALLVGAWTLADRTLYEVVDITPDQGLTLRDLRSGSLVEVRERTFSRQAKPGLVICGRAVPDGQGHQLIGGVFPVPPGREAELLDLLDEEDGEELLAWVARQERPPVLHTREGEPLVECTVTIAVPDLEAARSTLDRRYEPAADGAWTESHELPGGERILRATIKVTDGGLRVETLSAARADRVLATLTAELPGLRVLAYDRAKFDLARRPAAPPAEPLPLDDPEVRLALEGFVEEWDLRWCDEPIPALGGHTPREAAADPTRRESLERLLASYERIDAGAAPPHLLVQDPDRLRRLLGLETGG